MGNKLRAILFVEASTTGAGARATELASGDSLHVILLTRCASAYGPDVLRFVDTLEICETNDVLVVRDIAKRLQQRLDICAVVTTADMYVPQAAGVAGSLRLPGLRYGAARRARNKHKTRRALGDLLPEHNVRFALARTIGEAYAAAANIGYPLVVKPQEENDGLGVVLVWDGLQLEDCFREMERWLSNSAGQSSPVGLLLESYCQGPEFSVETLYGSSGGCQILGVTAKKVIGSKSGNFIESCHTFPYEGPEAALVIAATRRALAALRIEFGAAHTECRVNGNDVKIMEINPRLAGGKIGSHLIEMATGYSAVRGIIDAAMGKDVRWYSNRKSGAAIHFLYAQSPGLFRGIANSNDLLLLPGIESVSPLVGLGSRVTPPRSNRDRVAEIIARGENADDAYINVLRAVSQIQILLDPA